MQKEKIIIEHHELSEEQLKPIIENKKYSLIIAGAGTGKTFTMIGKIKYMLENNLIKKEQICPISFTNEATKELERKIYESCKVYIPCYTFHKLALAIIDYFQIDYEIAKENYKEEVISRFFSIEYKLHPFIKKCVIRYFHLFGPKKEKRLTKKKLSVFYELALTFLNLFTSNGYNNKDWISFFHKPVNKDLLFILYALYHFYQREKQKEQYIDFDDMITIATELIKSNKNILPFKLIIIDEFQDTSYLRFNLIKEIVKKTKASLCVVGDDFQSIYHFSGCDLDLFLNFNDIYPSCKIYPLTTTYRTSKNLITCAGRFILKNPYQIKKDLKAFKEIEKPIKIIYYYNQEKAVEKLLTKIPKQKKIFILARTNYELNFYKEKYKNRKNITCYTIHCSKGLESDIVILLSMEYGPYGLPSLKKDEKIISLVKRGIHYPYEEERRLFYVAITRAKEYAYLLAPKFYASEFIDEIKYDKEVEIMKI